MRFAFNERKTAQAMAFLLSRHHGKMNYMVAVKVLYLADRKTLIETGRPITGDWMVSLPFGPTLSLTLNLIRDSSHGDFGPWHEYIARHWRFDIKLAKRNPERDELSQFEMETITAADAEIGWMSWRQVSDYSHANWPEWRDPKRSSHGIEPEEILRIANKTPAEIEQASRVAHELWLFERPSLAGRSS